MRAGRRRRGCTSVAHSLRIPHYVVDEADQFERVVVIFRANTKAGRTPNPCVMCNEKPARSLGKKARALDCDYIATGHYAIIEHYADRVLRARRPAQGPVVFSFSACASRNYATRSPAWMDKPETGEIAFARPEGCRQGRQP